ncbi:hypothetical protein D3C80_1384430 [compost metagenome]
MHQLDLLLLRKGKCLIEHIHHQHRKQARLKLIGIGLGLCQLYESVSQTQRPTHLKLDLIKEPRVTADLMPVHIEQRKNRRVRCPQVVGQETQHYGPLFFCVTFDTQIDQAP